MGGAGSLATKGFEYYFLRFQTKPSASACLADFVLSAIVRAVLCTRGSIEVNEP